MNAAPVPVLLAGARTPFGRLGGALSDLPTRDLMAAVIGRLLRDRPELAGCDGVLLGQVLQAAQGQNPARLAATAGGIDLSVPATTINDVCLAGLATTCDAARRIRLGEGEVYIVGGGDSMSRAPHAVHLRAGTSAGSTTLIDTMVHDGLWCSLTGESMGALSERANSALGIGREIQDEIALRSHLRAGHASDSGRFDDEIVTLTVDGVKITGDEGIRRDTTGVKLAALAPAFSADGTITAGNAAQLSDGASAGAVTSLAWAERVGQAPLARIVAFAEIAGPDNTLHAKPAAAIRHALARAALDIADVDLFEINEAFAGVVAASHGELGVPLEIVNVNGGAIALGHPLGGTGFRLLLTLACELRRRAARIGVAALCGGGGQGMAVVIESWPP